jgi:nucleotide-binding universal stress UspA family protein
MTRERVAMERILCPIDFSEFSQPALGRAVRVARWFEAEVTALHVVPRVPAPLPTDGGGTYLAVASDLVRAARESAGRELERAVAPWAGEGVPIATRLVDGDPPQAIRAEAQALSADLVVMGTHGRSRFEHLVLGSVAERVLRLAPCPVLTLGRTDPPAPPGALFRRILCAVDLTPASAGTLDLAVSLAQESLGRVTLLHVVEGLLGESGPELYRPVPEATPLRRRLQEHAREQLHRMAASAGVGCAVEERVETGSAWREILRSAGETHADLIVVGAHAGGALGRLFLGSTVNQVVRQAPCPVLTVREAARRARPDGHALRVSLAGA